MADDRKKMYSKKGTGTIPKMKYARKCRNNTACLNEVEAHHNILANNLGLSCQRTDFSRNYLPLNSYIMETTVADDQETLLRLQPNINGNGVLSTPNTSGSLSRRDSLNTVPKCDNVTKYPDQKQIEDKLNKIQEYLRVTTSLMSSMNMKNTDEQLNDEKENLIQMNDDLKDSETKLLLMLEAINKENTSETNENVEKVVENGGDMVSEPSSSSSQKNSDHKVDHDLYNLRNERNTLLSLQQKAENKLREAKIAKDKLLKGVINSPKQLKSKSEAEMKFIENNYEASIKELEEQLKRLKVNRPPTSNFQDNLQAEVDILQQKLSVLHDANENRSHLIQLLDNRDAQLQSEHSDLQTKLIELQNKKMQVDQLVYQLQNLDEEETNEDVGVQVRKIVTMKDQLAKLKDMLEVVKTTETLFELQNVNDSDNEECAHSIETKPNLIQNDVRCNQSQNIKATSNFESNTPRWSCEKQVNKSSGEHERSSGSGGSGLVHNLGAKPKLCSEQERLRLQAELQAKKREFEEIMCKHKAGTSNLNHDVGNENKSDFGSVSNNSFFESVGGSWYTVPTTSQHNRPISSDRYSSDDCPEEDINEYSELNSSGDANAAHTLQLPSLEKVREEPVLQSDIRRDFERFRLSDGSIRSQSLSLGERYRSNNDQEVQNKSQTQKQLELIRSVCNSMLENQQQAPNVQHLRNNLTPSPLYSEPRQYSSPNPHAMNAMNVVNAPNEIPWGVPALNPLCYTPNDIANYQSILATNTLQTQAFMLNTLNHCCQMLWLQQRELAALRGTVTTLQDRIDQNSAYSNANPYICPSLPNPSPYRPLNNPKINHVSSAYSLPNLNQAQGSQTNNESPYINQNNNQNARLLDTGLNNNNAAHVHNHNVGVNNSVLHSTNSGVNQPLPSQIWNGQALNNQVAPGNRANNYWDNFRSYSRQNLLSTKSNEMLQNSTAERSNNNSHLFSFPSTTLPHPKLNIQQDCEINSIEEAHATQRPQFKGRRLRNANFTQPVPPDVLNINHHTSPVSTKTNENEINDTLNFQDDYFAFQRFNEISSNHSNLSDEHHLKELSAENQRKRNEWPKDARNEQEPPKSKLFEDLRENVYKEVASLIWANEGRPHFLIQLFRDLQLISSDPLRMRTLQSIQTLITNSSVPGSQGATQQASTSNPLLGLDNHQENSDFYSLHSALWPPATKGSRNMENEVVTDPDQSALEDILLFLNVHNDDILQSNLMESLKELLIASESFQKIIMSTNVKNEGFLKKLTALLTEALDQFKGKKISDIKMHLLQTIADLLRSEIALVQLVQESSLENSEGNTSSGAVNNLSDVFVEVNRRAVFGEEINPPQIQNGDLAEADQSRPEIEEEEDEEGAVGGLLNILTERTSSRNTTTEHQLGGTDDADLTKVDAVSNECETEFVEQGLDQVPTRLTTTHSRSRSNTPNRDGSSSRTDGTEHF